MQACTCKKSGRRQPLDGVNLIPYLTGETAGKPHEYLFWGMGEDLPEAGAVLHDELKAIFQTNGDAEQTSMQQGKTKRKNDQPTKWKMNHQSKWKHRQTLLQQPKAKPKNSQPSKWKNKQKWKNKWEGHQENKKENNQQKNWKNKQKWNKWEGHQENNKKNNQQNKWKKQNKWKQQNKWSSRGKLFNLAQDKGESRNLYKENKDTFDVLKSAWQTLWRNEIQGIAFPTTTCTPRPEW